MPRDERCWKAVVASVRMGPRGWRIVSLGEKEVRWSEGIAEFDAVRAHQLEEDANGGEYPSTIKGALGERGTRNNGTKGIVYVHKKRKKRVEERAVRYCISLVLSHLSCAWMSFVTISKNPLPPPADIKYSSPSEKPSIARDASISDVSPMSRATLNVFLK